MDVLKEAFQTSEGRVPPRTHFKPHCIETSIRLQWNRDRRVNFQSFPPSIFFAQECRQDEMRERVMRPDHPSKVGMLMVDLFDASGCFWFTGLLVMIGSESSTKKGIDPGQIAGIRRLVGRGGCEGPPGHCHSGG